MLLNKNIGLSGKMLAKLAQVRPTLIPLAKTDWPQDDFSIVPGVPMTEMPTSIEQSRQQP